jgi:uncharacterized protein YggE
MTRVFAVPAIVAASAALLCGQVTNRPFIRATGEATLTAAPDEAHVAVGVTTRALTAQDAADQNAARVSAVLTALRQLLGAGADIRTLAYSLSPNYRYPQGGGEPTLTGYTASNIVEVTTNRLTLVGRIIDTAVQAGATNVQSLRFGLKDDQSVRAEALKLASQQARRQADAIASGLGVRITGVLSAEEGSTVRPFVTEMRAAAAPAAATPIEQGNVQVVATVTLQVEIGQ